MWVSQISSNVILLFFLPSGSFVIILFRPFFYQAYYFSLRKSSIPSWTFAVPFVNERTDEMSDFRIECPRNNVPGLTLLPFWLKNKKKYAFSESWIPKDRRAMQAGGIAGSIIKRTRSRHNGIHAKRKAQKSHPRYTYGAATLPGPHRRATFSQGRW